MVYDHPCGRADEYGRKTEANDGEADEGCRAGDFLDEDEQGVVGGVEYGHGDELSQPEQQEVALLEQGQEASLWVG